MSVRSIKTRQRLCQCWARDYSKPKMKARCSRASERRNLVGSGDRSGVFAYNFPQGRITDRRINLTLYRLNEVIAGELGAVIDPLVIEYQADLLTAMSEDEYVRINRCSSACGQLHDNPTQLCQAGLGIR